MQQLSITQARRLALAAQGFRDPAPTGAVDRRHLRRAMGRLKLIQLDSVPVVARTQYLVLFSRLGPYRMELLDEIAYRHGEWFEAWAHEASLLPVETEPDLRWIKQHAADGRTWRVFERLFGVGREQAYLEAVYQEVVDRGPLVPGELSDPRPMTGEWWSGRSLGTWALDWLFRLGRLGVRRRGNFEKEFDLYERIVPVEILAAPTPAVDEAQRHLLVAAASAVGVGTAADLADYFRMPSPDAKVRLAELVEDGRLTVVDVEGWRAPGYVAAGTKVPRKIGARALLSPFDPVVWHRARGERLFDFAYRIEIYVPRAKRQHGYYVLPFLLGDRLVARVDLKTDRAASVLWVLGAFAEDHADPEDVAPALAVELWRLADLVGVDEVRVAPNGDLAATLAAAVDA